MPMPNSGTFGIAISPAVMGALQNIGQDPLDVVARRPVWIVVLEAAGVADPPLMVAGAVGLLVGPLELSSRQLLAKLDRLEHGAVAAPATAHVVDLALSRAAVDRVDRRDEVGGVNVIPDLLPFVTEYPVRSPRRRAPHQIGEEAVECGPGVTRSGQAAAPKGHGVH